MRGDIETSKQIREYLVEKYIRLDLFLLSLVQVVMVLASLAARRVGFSPPLRGDITPTNKFAYILFKKTFVSVLTPVVVVLTEKWRDCSPPLRGDIALTKQIFVKLVQKYNRISFY